MKALIMLSFMAFSVAISGKDVLTGRWESKPSKTGTVTGVVFKTDNTVEGYINKKPFVTGTYKLKDDVIAVIDNGCPGIEGTYKLIFFSNNDSLRFELIGDSCVPRSKGMPNLVIGRVK